MKNRRITSLRFLTLTALSLIGLQLGLTRDRRACAVAPKKIAAPPSATRGRPTIEHLEQTGLYNSLSAAVTAARYGVEERKSGGYEAANPKQNYRIAFKPEGVEAQGSGGTGRGWRMGMEMTAYGYGARRKVVGAAGLKAAGDRIEYERQSRDGARLSEWYEAAVYPVTIDPTLAQQAKLTAGDAAQADLSGASVAIDGDTAVVGAPNDDADAGADAGAAYVFVRSGTSWSQQAKLTGGSAQAGNIFGASVGISGDTVVVGAPFAASVSANSGQTYVFVRSGTSWSQQAVLVGGGAGDDHFGQAVAIDGDTIVVGAPFNDSQAGDEGSALVFVRSGTSWSQQAKLTAGDAALGNQFGSGVAIDGDLAVIASPFSDNPGAGVDVGAVYVFARSGTSWKQEAKLSPAVSEENGFFSLNSVAISGNTVAIGAQADDTSAGADAGEVTVFVRLAVGNWKLEATLVAGDAAAGDIFGSRVAISGDTLVAGAPFDDTVAGADAGSAYVFNRSGTTWTQQQKLTAGDAAAGDGFGNAVAISGDRVVVGAFFDDTTAGSDAGSAYVFAPAPPPVPRRPIR